MDLFKIKWPAGYQCPEVGTVNTVNSLVKTISVTNVITKRV